MPIKIRFSSATTTGLVLAKIGHPQRNEPLQTSKTVFPIREQDQEALTNLFLKPFKNLLGHRFSHHASLEKNEVYQLCKTIFSGPDGLLEAGCAIAQRLYTKSNHPNIKSGDLCIAMVEGLEIEGKKVQGVCILKAETILPFMAITVHNGDLELATGQGINPEKIDKGCLVFNHSEEHGFYVLTFDRAGAESRFWLRDFLGVQAVPDAAFLTNTYAKMAVAFLEKEAPARTADDDSPPWETKNPAAEALTYFKTQEKFDLQDFEEKVLKTPEAVAKFTEHRCKIEEETGQPLEKSFGISKKDVSKASKRVTSVMKLDTGVEIHMKPTGSSPTPVMERGFDETKKMKFIKVYFNKDVSNP
jgi:hypothetical protein